jgi:hypothetical protein
MADSAFWRDLAGQFIALLERLRAGGPTAFVYKEFKVLAGRGARELPSASEAESTPDLFAVWFFALKDAVKEEDLTCPPPIQSNEAFSVDENAQQLEMSYIDNMCEGSAIFCKILEDKAVEAEFKEKQRSIVGTRITAYRSEVKRFIAFQLSQNPAATDLEICRALDADGGLDLPQGWKNTPQDRLFVDAYSDDERRNKVEVAISKVRRDLRKLKVLPAR